MGQHFLDIQYMDPATARTFMGILVQDTTKVRILTNGDALFKYKIMPYVQKVCKYLFTYSCYIKIDKTSWADNDKNNAALLCL